jgi:acyl carrier protein
MLDKTRSVVGRALKLDAASVHWNENTQLLGALPELDSVAVVAVVTALEEAYGIYFADDEMSAEMFETLGTLESAVRTKTGEQ